MIENHTYPDGSQRVGHPPFPKLSPKQMFEAAARGLPAERAEYTPRRGRPPKNKDAA